MEHAAKIQYLEDWCKKTGLRLELEGECGLGRPCVGVTTGTIYPDYNWYDDDYERIDRNGDIWTPPNAYHKHPCVAVLGRGEVAESELYKWIKWFDDNGFVLETGKLTPDPRLPPVLAALLGKDEYARMVRK